ncbi:UPF0082 protein [Thecamonas trahens ATCC 50062]|uniref:UPF0082 protein n=1 Tax=Thecamonas trahens ATCC 50062 TaxID=461836 RepID=A0A0L0DSX9_THETB|nr:UPF0082 protein [Thecamonas trahens ATCC 50062]KNC55116.1 UPF0082 protein [Thecamonas trahens ATCC 50062]|eukprot:XP_013753297.1 UPF0082 protein [Thecamonas trahens ATCC 50062]
MVTSGCMGMRRLTASAGAAAGHSKWANIRHRKADVDKKRGSLLNRMSKEIMAAVKEGGGDARENLRLASIVSRARAANVPKANVQSAIDAALSRSAAGSESVYEGQLGPVSLLIQTLTDNKNRTTARVRHCLTKYGGALAGAGSAAWLFNRRLLFSIPLPHDDAIVDALMDAALSNGADDIEVNDSEDGSDEPGSLVVVAEPASSKPLGTALHAALAELYPAGPPELDVKMVTMPDNFIDVSPDQAASLNSVLDMLSDEDDVVDVEHNANPDLL